MCPIPPLHCPPRKGSQRPPAAAAFSPLPRGPNLLRTRQRLGPAGRLCRATAMKESPHEVEQRCGMELYLTDAEGGGGRVKKTPESFRVDEIQAPDGDGESTVFTLEKTGWELNHLIRDLARELGVSRKRFGFAGIKDKNAVTTQRVSAWDVYPEELEDVSLDGVEIHDIRTGDRVERGDLLGNRFEIRVADGDPDAYAAVHGEVEGLGGVPNYYGIQRFGAQRPITHRVGEQMLKGDWEEAARIYVAEDWPAEHPDAREARRRCAEDWGDFSEALDQFPGRLRYERAVLHGLAEGKSFRDALRNLPDNLLDLFVHAHQSFLFNLVLSERMRSDLPLDRAVEGDVVCFADTDTGLPNRYVTERVRPRSIDKINDMIDAGKAFVTAPLPGPDAKPAKGEPAELERRVLEDRFTDLRDADVKVRGMRREVMIHEVPELDGSTFRFDLPKGCYATTLLREYTKADPLDMV